jgi:hypothetical protein
MALALSIREKSGSAPQPQAESSSSVSAPENQAQAAAAGPVPSGTSAATVSRVRALYDFQPSEPGELQFRKGDVIAVLESVYKDWWKGSLRGQTGIFPLNYVEKLPDPTVEELQREAQMEAEVFGQIKNVEKLLTLLSTRSSELNVQENEEITNLYNSTLSIRPKLIELIGKYSQKKGMSPNSLGQSLSVTDLHSQMSSLNSTKSLSKREGIMNLSWRRLWLNLHSTNLVGLVNLSTGIRALERLQATPGGRCNSMILRDISVLDRQVCTADYSLVL